MQMPIYTGLSAVEDLWPEGLLILMLHSVAVPPLFGRFRGLHVTPRLLERHLRELIAGPIAGFTTLGEWNQQRSGQRRVVITFDDGYRNVFENGLPILQRLGLPAINYIVADLIGKSNRWDDGKGGRFERLMDRVQIEEWLAAGHEIGSHTLTHPNLPQLSPKAAREEIFDSKKKLEDMFSRPIRHFCYPYGGWDETMRALVEEAGYETATSIISDCNPVDADAFLLRRVYVRHARPRLAALTRY